MKHFFILCCCSITVWADSIDDAAKKAYMANINAVVVFTAKEGLNSGYYEFTRRNTSMYVLHVADRYHFTPYQPSWNLFVSGGAGYSEAWMTTPVDAEPYREGNITLTATNVLQSYVASLGTGVRYDAGSGWSVLGGLDLIYSRVRIVSRGDDEGIVEDFFKNNYNDNLTYRIYGRAEYERQWQGYRPYAIFQYALYETKSAFSFEQLSRFTSQSGELLFALGAETPALTHDGARYLTLEGYLRGSWIGGDLPKVVNFDAYVTVGASAYWYIPDRMEYIRRIYVDISTIQADGLHGYNLGIGVSLTY